MFVKRHYLKRTIGHFTSFSCWYMNRPLLLPNNDMNHLFELALVCRFPWPDMAYQQSSKKHPCPTFPCLLYRFILAPKKGRVSLLLHFYLCLNFGQPENTGGGAYIICASLTYMYMCVSSKMCCLVSSSQRQQGLESFSFSEKNTRPVMVIGESLYFVRKKEDKLLQNCK